MPELDACQQGSGDSEDRARCADLQSARIPGDAQERASHPGQQVDSNRLPSSKEPFCKLPEAPETPHVEADVQKVGMDKAGRHQPPVLSSHSERAEVRPPLD